jgi:hypothetical protein
MPDTLVALQQRSELLRQLEHVTSYVTSPVPIGIYGKIVPEEERAWATPLHAADLAAVGRAVVARLTIGLARVLCGQGLVERLTALTPGDAYAQRAHALLRLACVAWPIEWRRRGMKAEPDSQTPEAKEAWEALSRDVLLWLQTDAETFAKIRSALEGMVRGLLDQEPAAATLGANAVESPAEEKPQKTRKQRREEEKKRREQLVSDYLVNHKKRAAQGKVSIREVEQETGVAIGSIYNTPAWKALQDGLEKQGLSKRPRKRTAQAYTKAMDGVVQDARDAELEHLVREQKAEDHDPSPCDKDKGRRSPIRVQKKF